MTLSVHPELKQMGKENRWIDTTDFSDIQGHID